MAALEWKARTKGAACSARKLTTAPPTLMMERGALSRLEAVFRALNRIQWNVEQRLTPDSDLPTRDGLRLVAR